MTVAFVAALIIIQLVAGPVLASSASVAAAGTSQQQDALDDFPRIDKDDLPERYQDWLDEVSAIITDDEAEFVIRVFAPVGFDFLGG